MTVIGRKAAPGTTVTPIATVSSAGTLSSYVLVDHVHNGFAQIALSSHVLGDSSVMGSLNIVGGANITLSGVTAAAAATISATMSGPVAVGTIATSSSQYRIFPTLGFIGATASRIFNSSANITPFSVSAQLTVSGAADIVFRRTAFAGITATNTHSLSIVLYSADSINSSLVSIASGELSFSVTGSGTQNSAQLSGNRSFSMAFNTSVVLSSGVFYAYGDQRATTSAAANTGNVTVAYVSGDALYFKYVTAPWGTPPGITANPPVLAALCNIPGGILVGVNISSASSIAYSALSATVGGGSAVIMGVALKFI